MSRQPVVPAIAALHEVKDPATRSVLSALVDGWHVRNGQTGTGEHKFLTKADIEHLLNTSLKKRRIGTGVPGAPGASASNGESLNEQVVESLIGDLTADIMNSALWQHLQTRVEFIDRPDVGLFDRLEKTEVSLKSEIETRAEQYTAVVSQIDALGARVGDNETAIITETDLRVNADQALQTWVQTNYSTTGETEALVQEEISVLSNNYASLASDVTTVQARLNDVDGSGVAIEEQFEALLNTDGLLRGQYTVKIDNNGYVSGFGLASEANSSEPFSEFYVAADRFAIGNPAVPHTPGDPAPATAFPFIVQTTEWEDDNGNTQPAGVYMDSAFVSYAWIDDANIVSLNVDKLTGDVNEIRGASWYGSQTSIDGGSSNSYGTWTYVTTFTIPAPTHEKGHQPLAILSGWLGGEGNTAGGMRITMQPYGGSEVALIDSTLGTSPYGSTMTLSAVYPSKVTTGVRVRVYIAGFNGSYTKCYRVQGAVVGVR